MLSGKKSIRPDALKVWIVAPSPEASAAVRKSLNEIQDPHLDVRQEGTFEGLFTPAAAETDVIVVAGGDEDSAIVRLVQRFAHVKNKPAIVAVVSDDSQGAIRRALRAGADEVVAAPPSKADLTRALLKIDEMRRAACRPNRGLVCSLVSVSGGVGVTTITANLAFAFKLKADKRVAIIDLDLQASDLCAALNVEPENTIIDVASDGQRLDSIRLEGALTKAPAGIYLLAAPKRIEDSELVHAQLITSVVELMRELFDVVLIDCGRHVDECVVTAWECSDRLLYVIDQSIAALRGAWRFLGLIKRLNLSAVEPKFVVNRYSKRELIGEAQISQSLGYAVFAKIPNGTKSLRRAFLQGRPLFENAPHSTLVKSYASLAAKLSGWSMDGSSGWLGKFIAKSLRLNGFDVKD